MQSENGEITQTGSGISSLFRMLKQGVKAVPIVKLAQGVVGISSAITLIHFYNANFLSVAVGILIMLGLMFGLQLLAKTANQPDSIFRLPAQLLVWGIALFIIVIIGLTIGSMFFQKPIRYVELTDEFYRNPLTKSDEEKDKLKKQIKQLASDKDILANEKATLKTKMDNIADDRIRLRIAGARIHPDTPSSVQDEHFQNAMNDELRILQDRKTIDATLAKRIGDFYSVSLFSGKVNPAEPRLLEFIHDVLTKDVTPEEKLQELSEYVRAQK